jgi:hypothetical protein
LKPLVTGDYFATDPALEGYTEMNHHRERLITIRDLVRSATILDNRWS